MTRFRRGAVRVTVPATSANLGPGFDSFGLALARYDEVTAEVVDEGLTVEAAGESADAVPRDETHLVVASMLAAFRRWDGEPPGLRVQCRNAIPHGRGMGSSAAAIVAGVEAARKLLDGEGIAAGEALGLAAELEGHPDNVAAALVGGLTLAWTERETVRSLRLEPHRSVRPVVCVPGWPMSTDTARGLLPDQVPYRDAVFNASRSGLLVAALTQVPELLLEATEDRLHQGYRAPAMPDTADLLARLRGRGLPAVVSGAGPTVLVLLPGTEGHSEDVAEVAEVAGDEWRVEDLGVDLAGARTEILGRPGE